MNALHYFVWRKNGGRRPKRKQPSLEAATAEANRLADKFPGTKFQVLAVLSEIASLPAEEALVDA